VRSALLETIEVEIRQIVQVVFHTESMARNHGL
jgi:hypothetical protein